MRMTLEERRKRSDDRKAGKPVEPLPTQGQKRRKTAQDLEKPSNVAHVPRIMTADEEILPRKLKVALEHFYGLDRSNRDKAINTAAELSDMDPREFRKFLTQPAIQEIVQRRLDRIAFCKAAYVAKAQVLGLQYVDTHLATAVRVAGKNGDSKPMELAYERLGVRRDKNFMTHEQSNPQSRPQIYRVLEQTTTRTEQVTQREITTASPTSAGMLPSAQNSNSDILDY